MDWIKMGWGNDFSPVFDPTKRLKVDCSNVIISHRSLLEISKDAIKRITEKYPAPYTLLSTGGVDSQAMLYCWMNSGVDFRVVSFTYNSDFNDYDLMDLHSFSSIHGIKVAYYDFDMIGFLENKFPAYATEYQCISPQITAYMSMSEALKDGTVFFSGNLITPHSCFLDYTILGLHRYALQTKRSLVPFFFQHDPELAGAVVPLANELLRHSDQNQHYNAASYDFRCKLYQAAGVPIIIQLNKYSGFEKIKEYYETRRDLVSSKDRVEFKNMLSRNIFDIHFRYKMTRQVKYMNDIEYVFRAK